MPMHLHADLSFGFVTEAAPWAGAADHDPAEAPEGRLARRLAASGRDPSEVAGVAAEPCDPGGPRDGPWSVRAEASRVTGATIEAAPVDHGLAVDPAWVARLRAYCEVMAIPWREPGWCLTTRLV